MRPWRNSRHMARLNFARWIVLLIFLAVAVLLGHRSFNVEDSPDIKGGMVRGAARVTDGDSLMIGRTRVRLKGIDAPEGPQTCTRESRPWNCGEEARQQLAGMIGGEAVSCRSRGRDKHGRTLAICSTRDRTLNAAMVASGFALSYGDFGREESATKAARLGLWSGEFQHPRDWRRERGIGE